jgi:hypothetical protein
LLLLCLLLSVACGGDPARPSAETAIEAAAPGATTTRAAAGPSAAKTGLPATATVTPLPKPTAASGRLGASAQRSAFIAPLPTPTAAPSPTASATPVSTSSLPLTSTLAQALGKESDPPPECTYAAEFVADVTIPDDTPLEPGASFLKTWQLRNSGTCDWETGLQLVFIEGDPLGGPSTIPVSPTLAGAAVDVSIPLTAPQAGGTYQGHWELRTPDDRASLTQVYVRVRVPSPPPPTPAAEVPPAPGGEPIPPLVLLNYFAWFDGGGWDDCNISAGDKPLQPYSSDDPAAIARHVQMALDAGADGFTQQWYVPGGRTDRNFATLLTQSQGTSFRSTVVFLRHIWPGSPAPTQANVAEAVRYLLERYASHPNFLQLDGRPVLFFTDVYRVPVAAGQTPQQAWAAIRAQADPERRAWWIAEGLDPSYLAVFDGLWVYKITHATAPQAYLKAGQWAESVRRWEAQTGQRKLWIGTLTPGWDDLRAGCRSDGRVSSSAHRQERGDGTFYRATFDAALASRPNWLWVNSFNEWVEGTYVEPSVLFGDRYLQLTREFGAIFKGQ